MSLNRASDWDLLPALFRSGVLRWDWDAVTTAVATSRGSELESAAAELGLAVAVLPPTTPRVEQPWRITMTSGPHRPRPGLGRVIDLSVLWAGPLCTSLLRCAGATVTTVESSARPDGARRGDPALHQALHDGNAFVTVDFDDPDGVAELQRLVDGADVVVSSARMRALRQLGLDPFAAVERHPGLTWVGISAYGLTGPGANRIGYGDDAAVAGGLVLRGSTPAFFADAAADPITGLYAAIAALAVSAAGGGVVDVSLRDVAAHVARDIT
jgi:crotonobetainyl-CoA:carnitine CoA-transferase CaiB-like acyl-CoA transferase